MARTLKEQRVALALAIDALRHLIKEKQRYKTFPDERETIDEEIKNWEKAVAVLMEMRDE